MYKQESVQENETHKILWDFEIQANHRIPARRLDLASIIEEKITCYIVNVPFSVDYRVKMKKAKR